MTEESTPTPPEWKKRGEKEMLNTYPELATPEPLAPIPIENPSKIATNPANIIRRAVAYAKKLGQKI